MLQSTRSIKSEYMVGGHGVYVLIVIMLTTVAIADTVVSYG